MTRDAAMSPGDFVELVLNGLATESDMTAMKYLPMYVHIAIWQYASAASRAALALRWETGLRALAGSAEPGSDTQLAAVRTLAGWSGKRVPPSSYAGAARSAEGLDFLAGLLDESVVLDGLTVDTDLRWMLLTGLASAGRVDRARIAKELEQDHTISGKELAAAALAAMPTQDTKAEAWELATARDDVANETQRAVAYVFDVADQHDVLAPYLEKYLAVAETIWEDKGVQLARTTLEYMFPRALTSHETRDRVAAWLRQSSANPAAKRFVREGLAGIERALAAREKDASPAP
jgi:aminopeptidase N